MSGWLVSALNTCLGTRTGVAVGLFAICAAMTGVVVEPAAAQTKSPLPTAQPGEVDTVDDRPPLPPTEPKRPPVAAKYRIPNQDRAIFVGRTDGKTGQRTGGIEDDKPLASEKQNPDEYSAWTEVVLHAHQFAASDLERYAVHDLTADDLTYSIRRHLRLDLVRFDGKLAKARRVQATKALQAANLTELYEGWLVPVDESPANPLCVVFTEWPEGLPKPPEIPAGQPAGEMAAVDRWVSFAGYSFKLMAYPGSEAADTKALSVGWLKAPLLVGRSVTPLPSPPPELTSIPVRKDLRVFKLIRDDAPIARNALHWEENVAWNRLVLHARKFSEEELESAARRDLTFADLFQDLRSDYRLDLVYLEGRLIRLKKGEPSSRLAEAGVPAWYEGWLVPKGEPRGNPVCVILTDLPPGLEPQPLMSRWASFAGYSFKLLHYESGEHRTDDPSKNKWKKAPLLIGRSVTLHEEPVEPTIWSWFVPAIVGGLAVVVGSALTLSWWFRREDRQARAEIDAVRQRNPFGEGAAEFNP